MSLIKASKFNTHYENLVLTLEEGFPKDKGITLDTIYSEACELMNEYELNVIPFTKIFDYFYLIYYPSKDSDVKYIKKLIKGSKIKSEEILIYCRRVDSAIVKMCHRVSSDVIMMGEESLPAVITLSNFKLFLYYCFDLCFNNTKFYHSDLRGSYKDLENMMSFMTKNFKGFNELLISSLQFVGILPKDSVNVKISNFKDSDIALFQKMKFKYEYLVTDSLFKELMPEEYPYYSSYFDTREYVISSLIQELLDNEFNMELHPFFYKLLKKRAYLIPKNGISLKPVHLDFNLDIFERQLNGDNYIIIVTTAGPKCSVTMINLTKEFTLSRDPLLYDICNFLYSFYKLDGYAREMYGDDYANDPRLLVSFKTNSILAEPFQIIKGRAKTYEEFSVESPYYWRYKDKGRNKLPSQNSKDFIKSLEKEEGSFVYVSAYKRRLPVGQKASEQAKELSKFYCIELEDNETLVSPFVRSS